MRRDARVICVIGLIACMTILRYHLLLQVPSPVVVHQNKTHLQVGVSPPALRWAFATLLTASVYSLDTESGVLTYVDLAISLGQQMRDMYPNVPRLALLARGQVPQHVEDRLVASAGYAVIWRDPITPPGVQLDRLGRTYKDQFMKFWIWKETGFDRVVYIDADTYFTGDLDFYGLLNETSSGQFLACPTPWSRVDPETSRPITLNGGFFVVTPSEATFQRLMGGGGPTNHFSSLYPQFGDFFDHSEMGILMRDFPDFVAPANLSQYCADIQRCCVTDACKGSIQWVHGDGPRMVHGLKPSRDKVQNGDIASVFHPQVIHPFVDWGYSEECLMREFVGPRSALIKHNIFQAHRTSQSNNKAMRTQSQPPVRKQILYELFANDDPLDYSNPDFVDTGYPHTNIQTDVIDDVLMATRPILWVEAGSMLGGSAILTADSIKKLNLSQMTSMVCIDPFTGDVNMWAWNAELVRSNQWNFLRNIDGRPSIFQRFMANVDAHGHSSTIIPIAATSIVGFKIIKRLHDEKRLSHLPKVIYLDSAHERGETLLELQLAWGILVPGGIIFGDDWGWDAVREDVQQFSASVSVARGVLQRPEWVEHGNIMLWGGQWALCKNLD